MEAPRLEDIGHREWEEQSAISNWDDDFVFESPEKGTPKKKNKKGENNRKMEKKKQGKVYDVEKDVLEQIKVIEKLYQSCKELKRVREEIIESLRRVRGEDFFYGSQRSFAETVRSGGEKEPSEEEENLWEAWRQAEAFLLLSNNGYGNNGRGNGGRGGRDDGGVYGDRNEKIDFGQQLR
ncbi:hypothetical protein AX774_g1125 [Zancudomyces culisetae]|uniref:Uncharacterized protein n=1 Tax=Zancudomyces culisetae TaxID=1213189 RepID=A0A1R1PWL5_ZANCU|nr:hypothetical protein AX774_g1125 [Zancudomyces culisetae]|eukprot:OMH85319.1 hypothetical protein AX774_g1125 [Zancudomyces culisetae]